MGFFTDDDLDGLRVSRMIIHLVGQRDQPFVPRGEMEVQQEGFFRSRIQIEASDAVHSFVDGSEVRPVLERIASGELDFVSGGQQLAKRFFDMHVRQSISGAFFVIELRSQATDTVFFALIKYDYREAVELADQDGKSILRSIVQAFVKERRAVQKFCLIRVKGGIADPSVCASDRMEQAPDLTDYFERYLGVHRSRNTAELSARLNEALRGAAQDLRDLLPDNNIGGAVARAKLALQGRSTVSNDDVVDALQHAANRPEDDNARSRIDSVVRKKLRKQNLEDVEFRPDPSVLKVRPRVVVKTAEEVKLEFPEEELNHSVYRSVIDGETVFTVRTRTLVEDGTLPIRTR